MFLCHDKCFDLKSDCLSFLQICASFFCDVTRQSVVFRVSCCSLIVACRVREGKVRIFFEVIYDTVRREVSVLPV